MLADAVLEIAGEMEQWVVKNAMKSVGDWPEGEVLSWAKQLRRAVKAVEGVTTTAPAFQSSAMQHITEIEKARQEFRNLKGKVDREEREGVMVEVEDGSLSGTYFPLVGDVPEGSFLPIGKEAYQYRGGKLFYSSEQTKRLNSREVNHD